MTTRLQNVKVINETGHALDVSGEADATGVRLLIRDGLQLPSKAARAEAQAELLNLVRSYESEARELRNDAAVRGDIRSALAADELEVRMRNLSAVSAWIAAAGQP
jgi:hypothetical protein